ncbi:hypothetical protein RF11_00822 [Thelohanellus kitauei]|uniref:Uncharacterized protein n=1 Tax=Thelohanellus kitauei TaxID=669202 RepID=A0A0C2IN58_THEKT|nr:hypothetical protein RF11_00822 [Thelohanellus kitauei]
MKDLENSSKKYQRTALYHILVSVLLPLEQGDHTKARNLLLQLVNPPFQDVRDMMDIVQKNVGGFSMPIIGGDDSNCASKDFHDVCSPIIKLSSNQQSQELGTSLKSLQCKKRKSRLTSKSSDVVKSSKSTPAEVPSNLGSDKKHD